MVTLWYINEQCSTNILNSLMGKNELKKNQEFFVVESHDIFRGKYVLRFLFQFQL